MYSSNSPSAVGHLVDVQGDILVASLEDDEQGQPPTVTLGDEDVVVGQIGSYLSIRQGDIQIIAIITRMCEQEMLAAPSIDTPGEQPARLPFAKKDHLLSSDGIGPRGW